MKGRETLCQGCGTRVKRPVLCARCLVDGGASDKVIRRLAWALHGHGTHEQIMAGSKEIRALKVLWGRDLQKFAVALNKLYRKVVKAETKQTKDDRD